MGRLQVATVNVLDIAERRSGRLPLLGAAFAARFHRAPGDDPSPCPSGRVGVSAQLEIGL